MYISSLKIPVVGLPFVLEIFQSGKQTKETTNKSKQPFAMYCKQFLETPSIHLWTLELRSNTEYKLILTIFLFLPFHSQMRLFHLIYTDKLTIEGITVCDVKLSKQFYTAVENHQTRCKQQIKYLRHLNISFTVEYDARPSPMKMPDID